MSRVCLHTDARNTRSQAAIERIGGRFEGILRAHRMAADYTPRDSVRYSILKAEWPDVKSRLQVLLSGVNSANHRLLTIFAKKKEAGWSAGFFMRFALILVRT